MAFHPPVHLLSRNQFTFSDFESFFVPRGHVWCKYSSGIGLSFIVRGLQIGVVGTRVDSEPGFSGTGKKG